LAADVAQGNMGLAATFVQSLDKSAMGDDGPGHFNPVEKILGTRGRIPRFPCRPKKERP
jgi:hypothetical protein